jgi:hypothetical protein
VVQVGVAAFQRDGRGLGRLALGIGQFTLVWGGYLVYASLLVQASGGLTRSLMGSLLNVTTFRAWEPWTPFEAKDITDGAMATVLLIAGVFLILAAIGQALVMLMRSAVLLVLAATSPIAAAGLVGDLGKPWFWKAFRWFHAATFAPVLMVLVMGVGVKFAEGVVTGGATTLEGSVGTAFASTMLIAVSVVSPLALFKLLAFVDPGTASGANLRAGWKAIGGLQGLLRGRDTGSSTASQTGSDGRSAGENNADTTMSTRVTNALSTAAGGALTQMTRGGNPMLGAAAAVVGGAVADKAIDIRTRVGGAAADAIGVVAGFGAAATVIGADMANQTGVGHQVYHPDFSGMGRGHGARTRHPAIRGDDGPDAHASDLPDPSGPDVNRWDSDAFALSARPLQPVPDRSEPSSRRNDAGESA